MHQKCYNKFESLLVVYLGKQARSRDWSSTHVRTSDPLLFCKLTLFRRWATSGLAVDMTWSTSYVHASVVMDISGEILTMGRIGWREQLLTRLI